MRKLNFGFDEKTFRPLEELEELEQERNFINAEELLKQTYRQLLARCYVQRTFNAAILSKTAIGRQTGTFVYLKPAIISLGDDNSCWLIGLGDFNQGNSPLTCHLALLPAQTTEQGYAIYGSTDHCYQKVAQITSNNDLFRELASSFDHNDFLLAAATDGRLFYGFNCLGAAINQGLGPRIKSLTRKKDHQRLLLLDEKRKPLNDYHYQPVTAHLIVNAAIDAMKNLAADKKFIAALS